MSLDGSEGGPAEAKRRRVDKGTTPVKAWGSIKMKIVLIEPRACEANVYSKLPTGAKNITGL